MHSKPKVFVIGLNKTGTTSLGHALRRLGYRTYSWTCFTSAKLFHDWNCGDVKALVDCASNFDAFEDFPWSLSYKDLAVAYPDAKFILSTRNDADRWWRSISSHTIRKPWIAHEMIYGSLTAGDHKELYVSTYLRHNDRVREYFEAQPDRLLQVNIDTLCWKELCEFLNIDEIPRFQFPHANSKTSFLNSDITGFFWLLDFLVFWLEVQLASWWYYQGRRPHASVAISRCLG